MYGGEESSNNGESINNNKDTLQLSPHIAAHKSSGCSNQGNDHNLSDCSADNHLSSRLTPVHTFSTHGPMYKPNSGIYKPVDVSSASLHHRENIALDISRVLPQDLSSHSSKFPLQLSSGTDSKFLPHIQSIDAQGVQNASTHAYLSDRVSTYYKLQDGTTIVLVPTVDGSPIINSHLNSDALHNTPVSTVSGALPVQTVMEAGEDGNMIIPEILPGSILNQSPHIISNKDISEEKKIVKEEEDERDQKDLVRQALQAAVAQNSHRSGIDQEMIEYNYSAADIAGSANCLVPEDIICHSTFCPQTSIKPQELLMMNIHVSSSGQNSGKINGISLNPNEMSSGGQVVLLQPPGINIENQRSVISPLVLSPRRRRSKPNEAAQMARRERIANRMREKRANETDEQKVKRRIREAERMRKKRAHEDEQSKSKRRREAAERARVRRAKLSPEEKSSERQKAARRMRLRRQNENEDQKRLRRLKAAERMRRRRAVETPEERANRKLSIAMRMKSKRKRRDDDPVKVEDEQMIATAMSLPDGAVDLKHLGNHSDLSRDGILVPDSNAQFISQGQHMIVPSSLAGIPSSLALISSDAVSHSPSTGPHLVPVDLAPISHLHHARNLSATVFETTEEDIDNHPLELSKRMIIQCPSASNLSSEDVSVHHRSSESSPGPIPLHKSINSHHLPHLLHHLSPHPMEHHQQSQHAHEQSSHSPQSIAQHQSQSLQLCHQ